MLLLALLARLPLRGGSGQPHLQGPRRRCVCRLHDDAVR